MCSKKLLKKQLLSLIIVVFAAVALLPTNALAQDSGTKKNWGSEFGVFGGVLLPYLIYGVEEIQPFAGGRYAIPLNYGSAEAEFASSNAKGVSYKLGSLSYRGEITPIQDVTTLFYIGPDVHYYRGTWDENQYTVWGFHVGTGALLHVGGPVYVRLDMRFNSNPGTSLYLNFGLSIRTSATEGSN
jgi:hypothetical protein